MQDVSLGPRPKPTPARIASSYHARGGRVWWTCYIRTLLDVYSMLQPFWIVIGRCKITTQVGVRILKSAQWSYICTWHSWCWDLSLSTCYCLRAKNATVLYPSVDNVLVTWTPSEGSLQRQSALRHCRRQASTTAEWHSIVPVGIDTKLKPCISLTLHLLFCDFELFQLHRQWPSTLIGKIQL